MLEQVKEILGQPLNDSNEDECEMYLLYDMDCSKGLEKLRGSSLACKLFIIAGPPSGHVDKYYEKSIERMIVTSSRECDLIVDISPESITGTISGGTTSVVLSVSVRMGRKVVRFVAPCDDGDDDDLFSDQCSNNTVQTQNVHSGKITTNRPSIISLRTDSILSSQITDYSILQVSQSVPESKSGKVTASALGKRKRVHEKYPAITFDSFSTNTVTTGGSRDTSFVIKSKYFTSGNKSHTKKHAPPRKRMMKPLDIIVSY